MWLDDGSGSLFDGSGTTNCGSFDFVRTEELMDLTFCLELLILLARVFKH